MKKNVLTMVALSLASVVAMAFYPIDKKGEDEMQKQLDELAAKGISGNQELRVG